MVDWVLVYHELRFYINTLYACITYYIAEYVIQLFDFIMIKYLLLYLNNLSSQSLYYLIVL